MRNTPLFIAIAFFAIANLVWPGSAQAAQDATVAIEQAAIRERPAPDSKIIESKPTGAPLRVSSFSKDGWYKTKTSVGQYGWIWQGDITLGESSSDLKAANLEMKEAPHEHRSGDHLPWLHIKAGGIFFPMLSTDLAASFGQTRWYLWPSFGGFGEVQVNLDDTMRLGLRLEHWSTSANFTNLGIAYAVSLSSTPVMLGLDVDVSKSENFETSVGIYAGLGLSNQASYTASPQAIPNSFTLSSTQAAALLNYSIRYRMTNWLNLLGEAGLIWTAINGPWIDNTPQTELSSNHFNMDGLILDFGVQLNL